MTLPRIKTPKSTYTIDYPEAIEFARKQNHIFWTDEEYAVEKDVQDIMVNMGEEAKHGVITVLKLFTLYELIAGNEYWGERVVKMCPRPDIQRMANCFSFFELNVHAPFYNKLNEALALNTDDFYASYVDDPTLKERMEFIDNYVNSDNDLLSLGVFSMVEGAILYSSFAFLKHFQAQGKNQLLNVARGVDASSNDEDIHATGGAWLYQTLKAEGLASSYYTKEQVAEVEAEIQNAAYKMYEHEERIVDMIFEKGKIEGITELQLKNFVQSRINLCLRRLGMDNIFEIKYNPIKDWYYKNLTSVRFHDFFTGLSNQYNRDWSESSFTWGSNE